MILSEIVQTIVDETSRPDQLDLISNYTKNAVLQLHSKAKFTRDLVEENIEVPSPGQLIRLTLPPRFRDFQSVSIVNQFGQPMAVCEKVDSSVLLEEYGRTSTRPFFYITGGTYTVGSGRTQLVASFLFTSYFQSPSLTAMGAETWITQLYPEMVVNYVASKIHAKNGNNEKAQYATALYRDMLTDFLDDQDYVN